MSSEGAQKNKSSRGIAQRKCSAIFSNTLAWWFFSIDHIVGRGERRNSAQQEIRLSGFVRFQNCGMDWQKPPGGGTDLRSPSPTLNNFQLPLLFQGSRAATLWVLKSWSCCRLMSGHAALICFCGPSLGQEHRAEVECQLRSAHRAALLKVGPSTKHRHYESWTVAEVSREQSMVREKLVQGRVLNRYRTECVVVARRCWVIVLKTKFQKFSFFLNYFDIRENYYFHQDQFSFFFNRFLKIHQ